MRNDREWQDRFDEPPPEKHVIPDMTHPLSSAWDQPSRKYIHTDDTHALMSEHVFKQLHEYSTSQPSGVYEGKMWRSKLRDGTWLLRWFGFSKLKHHCSNNSREIILL